MSRALLCIAILAAAGVILAVILTEPRLAPTQSGVIDRTDRTDRLKTPPLDIRVVGECRSA
ncbi:hypothetical protein [Hansschlegelia plantiphila]|nr:hypothetical protein [Hansschlegelia plantiphila]